MIIPRCQHCKRRIWLWQDHLMAVWHKTCLEVWCMGYLAGMGAIASSMKVVVEGLKIDSKIDPKETVH